jgi:hypothetical protein
LFCLGRHKVCDVSCLDREYLSEKFKYIKVVVHIVESVAVAKKLAGWAEQQRTPTPPIKNPHRIKGCIIDPTTLAKVQPVLTYGSPFYW